mmetsp:Transcript_5719/g.24141  ORF Transcript_5719/g.24141 Transcript_5719/m.24141 type:complete len:505 (-) Transcript_5719:130-1644(-)|eukprot:CAMPEP_0113964626 /NCGR_PEP_ID=MMETSP0011_2-20120614/7259_1 /TAXON_ID=101924 /ORGANISM="Rhodosorus marinus" /LENGTH=504 /DNA_ID=CAMNT_0000976979 /DNA_START=88 /DNA_END=1602 /DNA_ORIENTATION=- /assembly_acc=CAM_ASM_000156
MASVDFTTDLEQIKLGSNVVFVGSKIGLLSKDAMELLPSGVSHDLWRVLIEQANPSTTAVRVPLSFLEEGKLISVSGIVTPARTSTSRHNHAYSPHSIAALLPSVGWSSNTLSIAVVVEETADAFGAGCAVSRAFPLFNGKTRGADMSENNVVVALVYAGGWNSKLVKMTQTLSITSECIRHSQRLVDSPPNKLTADTYVKECVEVAAELKEYGVEYKVFRMKELQENGMGCLEGVGRASIEHSGEPAMVILSRRAPNSSSTEAAKTVTFVGKGIVFDTGGLSLKPKEGMCEMKMDMGGSAACLYAFRAAVLLKYPGNINVVMCIAENGIGPTALKPDDIIKSYSGKTIEINNPDAEGRLVLADGVSYAARDLKSGVIVDMATLTGAQMVATGQRHGAVISNDRETENKLFTAGLQSGDLTWPLPYCPEFFRAEFASRVADMKNSVANRANAQPSCAAQFIADHLPADYQGSWAHIDMAGAAMKDGRSTGYGVALLVQYLGLGV